MVAARLALALLLAVPATAVAQTPTTVPYVNGVVIDLLVDGDTLYVGGDFTAAGAAAGPLVLARGSDGALVRSHPGFAQIGEAEAMTVDAVLDDGAGGWYAGGAFERVNGAERVALVRLRADGTVDPAFAPRLDADTTTSKVSALARHGDILWVGGLNIEGAACSELCALDARTGAELPIDPDRYNGEVTDLDLEGGRLFVASRTGASAIDAVSGARTGFEVPIRNGVRELDVHAGVVYLTDVQPSGEIFEPDVGAYRASDGGRLPVRFEGVREGLDVVATDDAVFVACQCSSGPSLLAYDPATGAKLSTDGYAGYVQHLAVGGGRLYVAGGAGGYAAFDLATRTRVSWTAPVIGAQPRALAVGADGTVALGGTNGAVNGAVRNDLAAFDLRTGALLPFDPRPDTPNALPPEVPAGAGAGEGRRHAVRGW